MSEGYTVDLDREITDAMRSVAERMNATGLSGSEMRERKHLAPFAEAEVERRLGSAPNGRTLRTDAFPGLGPVDLIHEDFGVLMELKWSYGDPNKVFESVWDAIKLAILGAEFGYEHLYVATGASKEQWSLTESADLFRTGTVDALDIWSRQLASGRGPNNGRTVCEDLVLGARGNQPLEGPESLELRLLGSFEVADDFELRLVSVQPARRLVGWARLDPLSGNAVPGRACVELDDEEFQAMLCLIAEAMRDSWKEKSIDPDEESADAVLRRIDDKLRNIGI